MGGGGGIGRWIMRKKLTAFFTLASAAITQAADTLAIRVPNGIHLNNPAFPKPRPLSRAKNHLIHTPIGPTMQANHNSAALPPCLNSAFTNAPQTPHNMPKITKNIIIIASWRLLLSTLQFILEPSLPAPQLILSLLRSHLKPLAVSIPNMMEKATRNNPENFQ